MVRSKANMPLDLVESAAYGHKFFNDFIGNATQRAAFSGMSEIANDGSASIIQTDNNGNGDLRLEITTLNDEVYIHSQGYFKLARTVTGQAAKNHAFGAACSFKIGADEPENLNMFFGFIPSTAANILLDTAGGPVTAVNQAAIWKLAADTHWHCGASLAAGTNPNHIAQEKAGDENEETFGYQSIMITVTPMSASEFMVNYYLDPYGLANFQVLTFSDGKPIVDTLFGGDNTELFFYIGLKQSGAVLAQLDVDWVAHWQDRNRPKAR